MLDYFGKSTSPQSAPKTYEYGVRGRGVIFSDAILSHTSKGEGCNFLRSYIIQSTVKSRIVRMIAAFRQKAAKFGGSRWITVTGSYLAVITQCSTPSLPATSAKQTQTSWPTNRNVFSLLTSDQSQGASAMRLSRQAK